MKNAFHYFLLILMFPACLPFIVQAQGMRLTEGVHLVMEGTPSLVFDNAGIINNGSISSDSETVIFTGNGSTGISAIGGNQPISFYNLRIDRFYNDVELDNDILVTGSLLMNHGILQLNNHLLDLGSTGMIRGENNQSFITGVHGGIIKIAALLDAPQSVNPGNIGVELTSAVNMGWTVISRGHVQQTGINGETSIFRYFEINPEINAGLDASLRFHYLDGELADKNQNELSLFTSPEHADSWSPGACGYASRNDHSLMEKHLDQLQRYTLAVGIDKWAGKTATDLSLRLYPNPTVEGFTVTLSSTREKTELIQLCDATGHQLEQREWHCLAGANSMQWNISRYAAGVYFIRFTNPALRNLKIVKQ